MANGGSGEKKPPNPHPQPASAAPPRLSIFELPPDFFDSCRLLSSPGDAPISLPSDSGSSPVPPATSVSGSAEGGEENGQRAVTRWTCNTCKAEFESLLDQRSHFKSDFHRLNVKLHMAGKDTIKEELFDELGGVALFEDCDISSVSGSEDESENELQPRMGVVAKGKEAANQKIHICLQSGNIISLWSCMVLHESEFISFESTLDSKEENRSKVMEDDLVNRLKGIIHEPRNNSHFRIVLLLSGGHFAACVFDGNSIIAHKTFHRYVVRAKAGKRQSTKYATGKVAHSAGSALRRYNEAALKKDIQDLLVTWKPYFIASSCILVHAPSRNSELLFGGENAILTRQNLAVRNIPLTVRRPTFKEAKRVYSHLVHVTYAINESQCPTIEEKKVLSTEFSTDLVPSRNATWKSAVEKKFSQPQEYGDPPMSEEDERKGLSADINEGTLLHEAAKSGDPQRTLELLEQGLDPCIKDSRGKTPYMLANEKEVRNTFRRFMALNLDKWDWHAANVPSPLTKEMEDSQAAKQAEKDAKRKAKAKELKKLRKAREKAQAIQPTSSQDAAPASKSLEADKTAVTKGPLLPNRRFIYSAEELRKQALDAEREKRAAAAERRIAALNAAAAATAETPKSVQEHKAYAVASSDGTLCSCCNSSLAGKVPFHRYHYKYCSTTCMHVHREALEDG